VISQPGFWGVAGFLAQTASIPQNFGVWRLGYSCRSRCWSALYARIAHGCVDPVCKSPRWWLRGVGAATEILSKREAAGREAVRDRTVRDGLRCSTGVALTFALEKRWLPLLWR